MLVQSYVFIIIFEDVHRTIRLTSLELTYFFARYIFVEALRFTPYGGERGVDLLQRSGVTARRNHLIDLERSAIRAYRSGHRGKGVVHR